MNHTRTGQRAHINMPLADTEIIYTGKEFGKNILGIWMIT